MGFAPRRSVERALVATDFSPASVAAAEAAAAVARRTGAKLWIIHAFDPATEPDAAARRHWQRTVERELEQLRAEIGLPSASLCAVAHARASEAILAFAFEHRAELIALGTHGRGDGGHALIGGVADKVVRHAACDAMVVRPGVDAALFPRAIVAATDLTPASRAAEERAAQWARAFASRLTLVHVFDESPPLIATRTATAHRLQRRLTQLRFSDGGQAPESWTSELVVSIDPGGALCRLAAERKSDLIVVGTHGRSGLARALLGSVAERVARRAPAAALVVR